MKKRVFSFITVVAVICIFSACSNEKTENNRQSSKVDTNAVLEKVTTTENSSNDVVTTVNTDNVEDTSKDESVEVTLEGMNTKASLLSKTENMALIEMLDIGKLPMPGYAFIISSDKSKNYNVPDEFDIDDFEKRTNEYINLKENEYLKIDIKELEWFSIICDDQSIYSVVVNQTQPNTVGIGPKTILQSNYGQEVYDALKAKISDDMSFDDIYDSCKSVITN
ncbi:hypothetical protein [Ruminococcus sp.]|uniref:hypothetical protein n=1 Tax=Ruminococcus sp. TaxID=41978 RepID=UPI0025CF3289|nr:hypothetical protein [Ruminococcus sp.]